MSVAALAEVTNVTGRVASRIRVNSITDLSKRINIHKVNTCDRQLFPLDLRMVQVSYIIKDGYQSFFVSKWKEQSEQVSRDNKVLKIKFY